MMRLLVTLAVLAPLAHSVYAAQRKEMSEFRPGVAVEYIYKQPLEGVYWTIWWGRLEKRDGAWRDVYFETRDKYVNKGILSFNCSNPNADIGLVLYNWGQYGAEDDKQVVIVRSNQQSSWAKKDFEPLAGEDPPYKLYLNSKKRFC